MKKMTLRVKIGETWYSSSDQPICVHFSEQDLKNVRGMDESVACPQRKYAVFPDVGASSSQEKFDWMQG